MKAKKNGTRTKTSSEKLEHRCETLLRDRQRLRHQVKQLTIERDRYRKSLIALLHEDIPVDKTRMLAMVGRQLPLRQFIEELRSESA